MKPVKYPSLWLSFFRPRKYKEEMKKFDAFLDWQLDNMMRNSRIRTAKRRIAELEEELSDPYRLKASESLAIWKAELDSLEDDGVSAIRKGEE